MVTFVRTDAKQKNSLGVGDEWLPTLSEMLNPGFLKGEDYGFLFFPLKMNVW